MDNVKKLLIVDDSRVSRMMIKTFMHELRPDWQLLEATSADEAFAIVAEAMPDYVTMDINMPGVSGIDAAAQIKQMHASARIILLTANVQESMRHKAEALGVGFVDKPVTAKSIGQAISVFERS